MVVFSHDGRGRELLEAETARLKALVADAERILGGALPEDVAPEKSPFLDRWILGVTPAPCLVGFSTGHPEHVGMALHLTTTPVRLLSDDLSWARTHSRWYRLGQRLDPSRSNS